MKRNFPNWLDAYMELMTDAYIPDRFHMWSGLSAVSSVLERKVWFPWSRSVKYFPNLFVALVGKPGTGKSTALNQSVKMVLEVSQRAGNSMNILPSQVTEAKLIELMSKDMPRFQHGNVLHEQCAGYFFASEASNSLKNVYGDFIACLTDFYDCPHTWKKGTMGGGEIELRNVCFNLIAGCTFDYLGKLVTSENILGGFASRLIYVVEGSKKSGRQKFQQGLAISPQEMAEHRRYEKALIEDLELIHKMVGPFTAGPAFPQTWEKWYYEFDTKLAAHSSEKLQSLLIRTNTNMYKVAMLLSACRGNSFEVTVEDWHRAWSIMEPVTASIPVVMREANASDTKSQAGLIQAVLKAMGKDQELPLSAVKLRLIMTGFNPNQVDSTLGSMNTNGAFEIVGANGANARVKLLVDPDDYF